jgi:hypothetical protein
MEENKIETFGGKIVQTTVYLSDYEIERLRQGFSVNKGDILLTFAEGSSRVAVEDQFLDENNEDRTYQELADADMESAIMERERQGFDVPDEFDDNTSDQDIETYENEEENIGHKEGQVD